MHKINRDQTYFSSVALKSCQSSNPHNIHSYQAWQDLDVFLKSWDRCLCAIVKFYMPLVKMGRERIQGMT